VRDRLDKLPATLFELYDDLYNLEMPTTLHDHERRIAVSVLKLMLYAQMQLDAETFIIALTFITGKQILTINHVLRYTSHLLVYNEHQARFMFIHPSVREFLEVKAEYAAKECYEELALYCLRSIAELPAHEIPGTPETAVDIDRQFAKRYGLLCWSAHCQKAGLSWIHDLYSQGYSLHDLAGILMEQQTDAPWIYYAPAHSESGGVPKEVHHVPSCAHELMSRLTARLGLADSEVLVLPKYLKAGLREQVEEFCGLGGVVPSLTTKSLLYGVVTFSADYSTCKVAYHASTSITGVLTRLRAAMKLVQEAQYCCDSFTMLFRVDQCVEFRDVPFAGAARLTDIVHQIEQGQYRILEDPDTRDALRDILRAISLTLEEGEWTVESILHSIALATQVLCVGFLSYLQGHLGEFDPAFLDTAQKRVELCGLGDQTQIKAELAELTCLSGLTKGPVVVFGSANLEGPTVQSAGSLDVMATAEQFLDTWGPGFIAHDQHDASRMIAVMIGDGYIYLDDAEASRWHWKSGHVLPPILHSFAPSALMRVGSPFAVNNQCHQPGEAECMDQIVDALRELGTSDSRWVIDTRGVGGQAGMQYVMATCQVNQKKERGVSMKHKILAMADSDLIDALDQYWGLRVSFCTGVAHRVAMKDMISDLLPAYVDKTKEKVWKDLVFAGVKSIFASKSTADIWKWWHTLKTKAQQPYVLNRVRHILENLEKTGYQEGKLVIAWATPFQHRAVHVTHKDQIHWARVLEDSRECATFAYMTSKCLPADGLPCQATQLATMSPSSPLLRLGKALATEMGVFRPDGSVYVYKNAASSSSQVSRWQRIPHRKGWLQRASQSQAIIKQDFG
jgi:hypothetical protein